MLITAFHDKPLGIYCFYVVLNVFKLHNSLLVDIAGIIAHSRELLGDFLVVDCILNISQLCFGFNFTNFCLIFGVLYFCFIIFINFTWYKFVASFLLTVHCPAVNFSCSIFPVVSDSLWWLFVCIVGLFVHCHNTQDRIQSRCDVGLHVCKYDDLLPSQSCSFMSRHTVTFLEKATFRKLVVNPGPLKFGFTNCRSIRNKGPILCEEVKTGNFDVFGLT